MPHAWKKMQLRNPTKIASAIAVSALNVLWRGHGILRTSPTFVRLVVVFLATYVALTLAEFLWLVRKGPKFTGFESPTADKAPTQSDATDPLAQELSELAPAELREETLELASAMKSFEAGTDREFVNTLAGAIPAATDAEKDEVLDQQ